MNRRNLKVCLDHAYGKTFAAIGKENNINGQRACQIYQNVLCHINIKDKNDPLEIAMAIHRKYSPKPDSRADTPEGFWREVECERFF